MHVCIHACIHTYIHPYLHPSIHTFINPSIHPSIHPYIHSYIHTYICVAMDPTRKHVWVSGIRHVHMAWRCFVGDLFFFFLRDNCPGTESMKQIQDGKTQDLWRVILRGYEAIVFFFLLFHFFSFFWDISPKLVWLHPRLC